MADEAADKASASSMSRADQQAMLMNAYSTERADLTGTYGYMCQMIGVGAAVAAPILFLATELTENLPDWVAASIPLPLVAVAALTTQTFVNLATHARYARWLEERINLDSSVGAPRGVTITQPVYVEAGPIHFKLPFFVLSALAPLGFFLVVFGVILRSLLLVDSNGIALLAGGLYVILAVIMGYCLFASTKPSFWESCMEHAELPSASASKDARKGARLDGIAAESR